MTDLVKGTSLSADSVIYNKIATLRSDKKFLKIGMPVVFKRSSVTHTVASWQ